MRKNTYILNSNYQVAIALDDGETHDQLCIDVISLGLGDALSEIVCSEIQSAIRDKIVPLFWSNFPIRLGVTEQSIESQFLTFHQFASAVANLQKNISCLKMLTERVNKLHLQKSNESCNLNPILLKTLLGQMPTGFSEVVSVFYSVSFLVYIQLYTNQTVVQTGEYTLFKVCIQPFRKLFAK